MLRLSGFSPLKILVITMTLVATLSGVMLFAAPQPAYACYNWSKGARVGLKKGAEIRHGPGFGYAVHTIVPEDNWQADIIDGPRNADGQEWWDISRKNLDNGGTGWLYRGQAAYDVCSSGGGGGGGNPTSASPQLTNGLNLSTTQTNPGGRIDGSFTVKNNGGQDWRPQRLGIGVSGPSYLDFGWVQTPTIRPGESYTFQGAIPNAPSTLGTYTAYASWQDEGNNWRSLGGDKAFTIQNNAPNPQPGSSSPQLVSGVTLSKTQLSPGERLDGSFVLKNNGTQDWRPQRLGIGVSGPSYVDFGWVQGLTIRPGESYTFQGAIPNVPSTTGTYTAYASWQDANGAWNSLGGDKSFTIGGGTAPANGVVVESVRAADAADNAKSTFAPGETVRFYATVRNNGTNLASTALSFVLTNPTGGTVTTSSATKTLIPGSNTWQVSFTLGTSSTVGTYNYSVTARFNGQSSSKSGAIGLQTQTAPSSRSISIEQVRITNGKGTDKSKFLIGDGIGVVVSVRNSASTPVSGVLISWDVIDPNGTRVTSLSVKDGSISLGANQTTSTEINGVVGNWAAGGYVVTAVVNVSGPSVPKIKTFTLNPIGTGHTKQEIEMKAYPSGRPKIALGEYKQEFNCIQAGLQSILDPDWKVAFGLNAGVDYEKLMLWSDDPTTQKAFQGTRPIGVDLSTKPAICLGLQDTSNAGGSEKAVKNLFIWVAE